MRNKINLHTHSNYSLDGEFSANDLIKKLIEHGFNIVSITDHNTCEAYKELEKYDNLKIITGIEADAIANGHTYDFLCYNFELNTINEYVLQKYENVEKRQKKIFDALVEKCMQNNISLKNIQSYDSSKEYAHMAVYRMLDEDLIKQYDIENAGDFYRLSSIDKDFPLFIDMHIVWPDITELVDIIHENNGKVFLAHPYRYHKDVLEVLNDVKNYVDGIEICNNPNSIEEVEFLYKYAKENNLLISCGSDYHGDDRYSMDCDYLTEEMINDVLSWIRR